MICMKSFAWHMQSIHLNMALLWLVGFQCENTTFLILSHNFNRSICKYYQENKLHLPFSYFLCEFKLYEQGTCQVTNGWVSGKGKRKVEKNGSQILFEGNSYNLQHSCNSFNCLTWARTVLETSSAKIQYAWDDICEGVWIS